MSLADVVNMSITVKSLRVAKENFGTPLLLGYHTAWIDKLVHEYADETEMLDDGFTASHYLYKAVQSVLSQDDPPKTVKVGRRTSALTHIVKLTPNNTTEGHVYELEVDGSPISYTVLAGATVQIICEAIQPLIDALATVGATEDNTIITITKSAAGTPIQINAGTDFTILDDTADTSTDDALAAILAEDSTWYGLTVADSFSKATGLLAAAAMEAERKICVLQSADSVAYDSGSTTDLIASIESAAYSRTTAWYHRRIGGTEQIACALLGMGLGESIAKVPGKVSWAHKALNGITVDDFLTQAQQTAIADKSGNYYITLGAQGDTWQGLTGSGEFVDIIHFVDYLYSRIRLRVVATLQSGSKIPYTNSGADLITGAVMAMLLQNVGRNGAPAGLSDTPEPFCTHPDVADVDEADRTARLLPDINFGAQLQGAIHATQITGALQV